MFVTYVTAAHRIPITQLGGPLLVTLALCVLIHGTYWIAPLTRELCTPLSSLFVIVLMTWMDYPATIIPFGLAVLLVVLAIRLPRRYKDWVNRVYLPWLLIGTALLVSSSIAINLANRTSVEAPDCDSSYAGQDIYLVVPDRFTSVAGLVDFGIGEEAEQFVEELESRGFYVRQSQLSEDLITPDSKPVPTTRTTRFMASLLNSGVEVPLSISYNGASRLIKTAGAVQALRKQGYEFVNIGSWFTETKTFSIADRNYSKDNLTVMGFVYGSELGEAVIDRSILRYMDLSAIMPVSEDIRREEHLFQRQQTIDIAAENRTHSVFALTHLMLPHIPFVWDSDGQPLDNSGIDTQEQYCRQVVFAMHYLVELVDGILANQPDAIILIQADEGCLFHDQGSNDGLTEAQWNGQLTAWRIPGSDNADLDEVRVLELLKYINDER